MYLNLYEEQLSSSFFIAAHSLWQLKRGISLAYFSSPQLKLAQLYNLFRIVSQLALRSSSPSALQSGCIFSCYIQKGVCIICIYRKKMQQIGRNFWSASLPLFSLFVSSVEKYSIDKKNSLLGVGSTYVGGASVVVVLFGLGERRSLLWSLCPDQSVLLQRVLVRIRLWETIKISLKSMSRIFRQEKLILSSLENGW